MTDERSELTPALVTELKRLSDERHLSTPKRHVFLTAMTNHAPALLEAVETMHAALEKLAIQVTPEEYEEECGSELDSDDGTECMEMMILDARNALARVAALLGEGRGK